MCVGEKTESMNVIEFIQLHNMDREIQSLIVGPLDGFGREGTRVEGCGVDLAGITAGYMVGRTRVIAAFASRLAEISSMFDPETLIGDCA